MWTTGTLLYFTVPLPLSRSGLQACRTLGLQRHTTSFQTPHPHTQSLGCVFSIWAPLRANGLACAAYRPCSMLHDPPLTHAPRLRRARQGVGEGEGGFGRHKCVSPAVRCHLASQEWTTNTSCHGLMLCARHLATAAHLRLAQHLSAILLCPRTALVLRFLLPSNHSTYLCRTQNTAGQS